MLNKKTLIVENCIIITTYAYRLESFLEKSHGNFALDHEIAYIVVPFLRIYPGPVERPN